MDLVLKVALNNEDIEPVEPDDGLKTLVMFADAAAGSRAILALDRIARGIEGPGRLICALWNFDFLARRSLLEIAAREAVAADVVLIALGSAVELPGVVKDWINLWLSLKNGHPVALGAIIESEAADGGAETRACSQLQEMARLGRMDFFATGGGAEQGTSLASAMNRAMTQQGRGSPCSAAAPLSSLASELRAA